MTRSSIPDTAWAAAEAVYPDAGPKASQAILKALGHEMNTSAIAKHMERRGIRLETPENLDGRWTEQEIETLRLNAPRYSTRLLKERFFPDRTMKAVQEMASREGIRINFANREQGGRTEPMLRLGPWDDECRSVYLSDQQIPEYDYSYHRVATQFLSEYLAKHDGPKILFILGDFLNATVLGRFDHETDTPDMEAEIREGVRVLEDYRAAAGPDTLYVFVAGNHEDRLSRQLMRNPNFKGLIRPWWESLEFDRIFGSGNWHYVPYTQGMIEMPGPLIVTHGYRVSSHSAYAAKLHVDAGGVSVIHGHTHRLGIFHKTLYDRQVIGIENGSGCGIQSYNPGFVNQQVGFSYTRHWGQRFEAWQCRVIDGKAYAEGRWWG